eukprot:jgi/Hompol1/889/HPOL_002593-RA
MDLEDSYQGDERENWVDVDDSNGRSDGDMSEDDEEDAEYTDDASMDMQESSGEDAKTCTEAAEQQAELRKQIQLIQGDTTLTGIEKAKRIQELMTMRWTTKQQKESSKDVRYINRLADKKKDFDLVTDSDRQKTFHVCGSLIPLPRCTRPLGQHVYLANISTTHLCGLDAPGILGCKHYQRSAKLQAHCCGKWDTCRFCHDEVSDHTITRNLVATMMCMFCTTVQPAGQDCINPECGKRVARYYCKECKLWDDDPRKTIYHCHDCGICRIGKGLGIDYFHCPTCNVCMAIGLKGRHKCIERNLESDCPICGEYMFTSTSTVIFMPCGHCMHHKCHQQYIQTSYQCPTCLKSLADMSDYFRRVDATLAQHQMPPEYSNTFSYIYCNDCEKKSYAKYHFIYHKCAYCCGYNTKLLQTRQGLPPDAAIAKEAPPAPTPPAASAPSVAQPSSSVSAPTPTQNPTSSVTAQDDLGQQSQAQAQAQAQAQTLPPPPQQQPDSMDNRTQHPVLPDQDAFSNPTVSSSSTSSRSSSSDSRSFWCHRCQLPAQLFSDGTTMRCVTCSSDFVEEL